METKDRSSDRNVPRKKLVVVGDGACGKTCLLIAYTRDEFSETHIPTVFETYVTDLTLQGQRIQLVLWDTAGQEDYELLRPLSYPNTDVLLLCFAIDSRDSYENIFQKWFPEVSQFCPKTPLLLVGTKVDLRTDDVETQKKQGSTIISSADGSKLAKSIEAVGYVECSSKSREGIQEVFETAARFARGDARSKKRQGFCSLL